jgi:hypothetical protein
LLRGQEYWLGPKRGNRTSTELVRISPEFTGFLCDST